MNDIPSQWLTDFAIRSTVETVGLLGADITLKQMEATIVLHVAGGDPLRVARVAALRRSVARDFALTDAELLAVAA